MSKKKKTRAQKITASLRKATIPKPKIKEKENLYNYDPKLITKDILKTFYLAIIFFLIIGIFYWFFNIQQTYRL